MTHTFLGEVLVNEVITTAVKEFKIPMPLTDNPQPSDRFVIVWSYHEDFPTADTYAWSSGKLLAWNVDSWKPLENTEAYNPLDPNPNHQIIALFKKD